MNRFIIGSIRQSEKVKLDRNHRNKLIEVALMFLKKNFTLRLRLWKIQVEFTIVKYPKDDFILGRPEWRGNNCIKYIDSMFWRKIIFIQYIHNNKHIRHLYENLELSSIWTIILIKTFGTLWVSRQAYFLSKTNQQ